MIRSSGAMSTSSAKARPTGPITKSTAKASRSSACIPPAPTAASTGTSSAIPTLPANFRVIAFDMPWHGKSLPPSDFYLKEDEYKLTTKFYADFIVAFCHALELKKPVIMGQSMGGNVCLALALRYETRVHRPDRARGLRLLAGLVDRAASSSAYPRRRGGGDLGLRAHVAGNRRTNTGGRPGGTTPRAAPGSSRAISTSTASIRISATRYRRSPASCRSSS